VKNADIATRPRLKICQHVFPQAERFFDKDTEITLYKGKGCTNSSKNGIQGRTGIFEVVESAKICRTSCLKILQLSKFGLERAHGIKPYFMDGSKK
jgi:type II secretory ATPase GspE/PulE/Tfp pilus assembly ATPase PilB-like protein